MEILRIKQKAVSNLEEVQFELANLQVCKGRFIEDLTYGSPFILESI